MITSAFKKDIAYHCLQNDDLVVFILRSKRSNFTPELRLNIVSTIKYHPKNDFTTRFITKTMRILEKEVRNKIFIYCNY